MTEKYKAILYALGAVPVSELRGRLQKEETSKLVRFKDEQAEVNGWISPYWTKGSDLKTNVEKERYGIQKKPLTYAEYISLFDLDEYRKTNDPLHYATMAFALDNMLNEDIRIENPDDIIKVYESGIGLEERTLSLLRGRLSSVQAMKLYGRHRDARLLEVLPIPGSAEKSYIEFLRNVSNSEPNRGWYALGLLYKMDKAAYKEEYRDFMIHKVRETKSLQDRMGMYQELVMIGDDKSIELLAASLLKDPVTEAREAILLAARDENVCTRGLLDSVFNLAEGLGEKHRPVTPSRMRGQWHYSLRKYLTWIKENENCDINTRACAESALELLGESPF